VPVVSYAPRPMWMQVEDSRTIIVKDVVSLIYRLRRQHVEILWMMTRQLRRVDSRMQIRE
jgi:hypothetical protein